MSRARTVLFWVAATALLAGHVAIAVNSLVTRPFWEDEAFNLTVPRNLLAGLGYASDGALSGSTITAFDPRISTGPVVLLPVAATLATGMDPVLAARIVPLAFWALLVAGSAVLGWRIAGPGASLLAAAVPLAFTADAGVSPIQGPADLLGEIPAAALLVWALVVLQRRPWLAGLLVGLAVQAKLIALLALPAFAVALWVLADGSGRARVRNTLRRSWLPLALVALPTALLELAALLSLGPAAFVDHLRELVRFVRSGGQGDAGTTIVQKLSILADSWSLPAGIAVIGAALAVGLAGIGVVRRWRSTRASDRAVIAYALAAAVGALAFVGWWATASRLPLWVRHPAPGILAFFPVLAAVALWSATRVVDRSWARVAAVVLALIVAAAGVVHVASAYAPRPLTLEQQRQAVVPLAEWVEANDVTWIAAEPWGIAVAPIVLAGSHLGLHDAPSMADVPRLTIATCTTETLVDVGLYRVCAAP